jgi:hypothetical protein
LRDSIYRTFSKALLGTLIIYIIHIETTISTQIVHAVEPLNLLDRNVGGRLCVKIRECFVMEFSRIIQTNGLREATHSVHNSI